MFPYAGNTSLVKCVPPPRKHISLAICVPLPWKHISLVICVLVPGKHISHIPCVICISTWKTNTDSDVSPTREQTSHSDLCFPTGEHIFLVVCVSLYRNRYLKWYVFFLPWRHISQAKWVPCIWEHIGFETRTSTTNCKKFSMPPFSYKQLGAWA